MTDNFNPISSSFTPQPCPSCGHCPTCGRGPSWPVQYYGPWWSWNQPVLTVNSTPSDGAFVQGVTWTDGSTAGNA